MSVIGKDAEIMIKTNPNIEFVKTMGVYWDESSSKNFKRINVRTISSDMDKNFLSELVIKKLPENNEFEILTASLAY